VVTNDETFVVESLAATTTETVAALSANKNEVVDVSFRPTRPSAGFSQEVFGTVALTQVCFGSVENIDGTRVQHVHDRALLRAVEDLVNELRELRKPRDSEKGD
jgi:hypothetical protein